MIAQMELLCDVVVSGNEMTADRTVLAELIEHLPHKEFHKYLTEGRNKVSGSLVSR